MSTQIYGQDSLSSEEIKSKVLLSLQNELQWLIAEIILPQLPSLKSTLEDCLAEIDDNNHNEIKLPMSSHKTEILKGVISRTNYRITGLNIWIKSVRSVNGGKPVNLKLIEGQSIILRQIIDCQDAIQSSIKIIERINTIHEDSKGKEIDLSTTIYKNWEKLLTSIQTAKTSLKTPNPEYMFPMYRPNPNIFDPQLPALLSLDFCVSNSDLGIDLKGLHSVTTKPWSTIVDENERQSFADKVRMKISTERNKSISRVLVDEYRHLLALEKEKAKLKEDSEKTNDESSAIGSIFSSIFSSDSNPSASALLKTAHKYLEQCVTYTGNEGEPRVVTVSETCDVVTSDPILLSITIKLDSIEKACSKIFQNLRAVFECQRASSS